ncbi:D-alanyl-lipoteichoic acid biosynthesis protein DltD [Bacillus sp. DX1.1]|uniref:D-alanyl-lipoteichoic acid biosynthesis protein DltD n=1 Tax=unclassified Bacillus (in: firmicutes) TaxID=185979 RepID=UPI0025708CE0|nr:MULTISPECIES: D-alanyl-lipoteichoic acid biosynthesis protein DltD [unclassified Bacillus (in: firmicutes)]MDM5153996.1 D-alanyl-lipoteichoic acid biosynthesis protein DltD [Bacillus sp. DX1.1]WJE82926.1 D-alanyl-lipoteichoic acid biosynthesis protein DltD [Bacillus sp. DX3.1]
MKKATFGPMLLALALFAVFLLIPIRFLSPLVSDKKVEQAATSVTEEKIQSMILQQKMLEDPKYLPMYGSSEFKRLDAYHPSSYFKVKPEGFTPFLLGRGGTQNLIHVLNFASTMDDLKDKKMIFVLSPQWFVPQGIDELHFAPNFSKQQGYHFLFNNDLKPEMKKHIAKRLLKFDIVKKETLLKTSLEGIAYDDTKYKVKAIAAKPFAYIYRNILDRKDLFTVMFNIKPPKQQLDPALKNMNWEEARKHADQTGAAESKSNKFGIDDSYFHNKIKNVQQRKGYLARASYDQSPEYEDLQIVLDLLKQTGAKPLFISVPVKGPWYDYAGFPKERRELYYKKVHEQIKQAGYPIADFSNHEYDKYFLKDHMHLGWKGWVYIDEAVQKFYKTN